MVKIVFPASFITREHLKGNFGLGREDCQQAMTDEFMGIVAGCLLGTDVCHWVFKTKSTWFKVNKINSPLRNLTDLINDTESITGNLLIMKNRCLLA